MMTNLELYELLETECRDNAALFADNPLYAAYWLEQGGWAAEMAAGYRAHGEDWLPF